MNFPANDLKNTDEYEIVDNNLVLFHNETNTKKIAESEEYDITLENMIFNYNIESIVDCETKVFEASKMEIVVKKIVDIENSYDQYKIWKFKDEIFIKEISFLTTQTMNLVKGNSLALFFFF